MNYHIIIDAPAKRRDPTQSDDIRNRIKTLFRRAVAEWRSELYRRIVVERGLASPIDRGDHMREIAAAAAVLAFAATPAPFTIALLAATARGMAVAQRELDVRLDLPLPQGAVSEGMNDLSIIMEESVDELAEEVVASPEEKPLRLYQLAVLPVLAYALRSRLQAVATTRVTQAFNAGKLDVYQATHVGAVAIHPEMDPNRVGEEVVEQTSTGLFVTLPYASIQTAGDDKVCSVCSSFEGESYTVEQARDLIPAHPNCRCSVILSE